MIRLPFRKHFHLAGWDLFLTWEASSHHSAVLFSPGVLASPVHSFLFTRTWNKLLIWQLRMFPPFPWRICFAFAAQGLPVSLVEIRALTTFVFKSRASKSKFHTWDQQHTLCLLSSYSWGCFCPQNTVWNGSKRHKAVILELYHQFGCDLFLR